MADMDERSDADKEAYREIRHRQCIEELFDDYADDFDQHLQEGLRYDIPNLMRKVVLPDRRFERCLDLGCGTGRAGQAFRERCGYLEGCDLSSNMVEKARERELYDDLHSRDLV